MSRSSSHAFILAGGLGTRLHAVTQDAIPKALADINGRPFLDYLLHDIAQSGAVHAVTLCTGHYSAMIEARYGPSYSNIPIHYSKEKQPSGTGGAAAAAMRTVEHPCEPVFLMNGDCMTTCCLHTLRDSLQEGDNAALALVKLDDAQRFGAVSYNNRHIITAFNAAGADGAAYINAGRYYLRPSALPDRAVFSIEYDYFMPEAPCGTLRAHPYEGIFLDIGIPEDYKLAQTMIPKYFSLTHQTIGK